MSESKEMIEIKETKQFQRRTSKRKRVIINYKETKTYRIGSQKRKRKSKRQKIDSDNFALEYKSGDEPLCIELLEGARSISTEFGGIPIDLRGILEPPPKWDQGPP